MSYSNKTPEYIAKTTVSVLTGIYCAALHGYGDNISSAKQGGSLLDYLYSVLWPQNLRPLLTYNSQTERLEFDVVKAKDRTAQQTENPLAVFSADRGNIGGIEYDYSEKEYKNCAVVAGAGEGAERIVVRCLRSGGNTNGHFALFFCKIDAQKVFRDLVSGFAATIIYIFGGADKWLIGLIVILAADYISGVIAAVITHEVNSKKGFAGILKKVLMLCVVAVAHIIDSATGADGVLRALTIGFLLANESISVLENCGRCGVPLPKKLLEILEQLKSAGEKSDDKKMYSVMRCILNI